MTQVQNVLTTIVSEILEEQQNLSETPLNGEELYNDLATVVMQPLDINSASKETLEKLPFLSDYQIENILYYVYTSGPLLSLYELKAIPGMHEKTIQWLVPFIALGVGNNAHRNQKWHVNHEFLARYIQTAEVSKGFQVDSANVYLGDRNAVLLKLDGSTTKGISYHILAEKDKGEKAYTDFIGGSAEYVGSGILSKVIIGDYKIRTGQGLISWSGNILGKSMEPDLVRRRGEVLSMYKSSMEYGFYRGAAINLRRKHIECTIWGSKLGADASIDSTATGLVVRSINTTGYHNTRTTLLKKNNVNISSAGTNIKYNSKWIRPGFTFMHNRLSLPFHPTNDLSYTHIRKTDTWQQYSTDFFSSIKKMHFWGEAALQSGAKFAGIFGTTLYPGDALQASLVYRNYSPGFYTFYGHAFGETGLPRNEKGIFLGLKLVPLAKLTISTSFDIYAFPWLKYQQSFVAEGFESFARINYSVNRYSNFYVQLRYEKRDKLLTVENNPMKAIKAEERSGIRGNFKTLLGQGWEMNSRMEVSYHRLSTFSKGLLLSQDLSYNPPNPVFSGNFRFAWFSTTNYDARIYAYENDVLYAFSIPAYYGEGIRTYINLKFKPIKYMEFWIRMARMHYFDKNTIGSGLDEISSPHKTEIKLQARIKF